MPKFFERDSKHSDRARDNHRNASTQPRSDCGRNNRFDERFPRERMNLAVVRREIPKAGKTGHSKSNTEDNRDY